MTCSPGTDPVSEPSVPVSLPEREQDTFDDWYRAPIVYECPEPRLEIRRARADEFEAVWDLIDLGFATKRPRAMFDWLYRRNPCGLARCYVAAERSTGRLVGTKTDLPWPAAQGPRALRGLLGGDSVVAPDWRGHRTGPFVTQFRVAHPWCADMTRIGWPNEVSRHIIQRDGRGADLAGWLRYGVLPISPANLLARHWVPRAMATAIGRAWETLLGVRQRRWTRAPSGTSAREIQRFDSAFDTVTARAVTWPGFWCPHRAEFLNWRYIAHPVHSYVARAVLVDDEPVGYTVVRTDGHTAVLMEFVVAPHAPDCTRLLLWTAIDVARSAGCTTLGVHAPPRWPHWRTIRQAGFWDRPPTLMLEVWAANGPEAQRVEAWQLSGGDVDAL